jgi:hypothetical protein
MDDLEAAHAREREAKLLLKRDQGAYESAREEAHHKEDQVKTQHPAPYTLHPTPYTLHPTPCTLHPTPYTLFPQL